MNIAYYTLGCKVNQYETEKIRASLEEYGFNTVPFNEVSSVYIINTCTVTSSADGKSRAIIRKAKKTNPSAHIIVTGCYSEIYTDEVKSIEGVDLIIFNKDKSKANEIILDYLKELKVDIDLKNKIVTNNKLRMRTRAVLKVQDGCNQFCSYCLIPYARNYQFSEDYNNIINEVRNLCDNDYKEVILTGIRLGSYKNGNHDLCDLIEDLLSKTSIARIRLSSIEMWEIGDRLLDIFSDDRMCKHLHIPLQSGCDEILKLMNRPYDTNEYRQLIDKIRNFYPNIGITTDVISGFPKETDEYFQNTYNTIEDIGFSRLHVFKYSKRPNTVAFSMTDHVDPPVKKERVKCLTELGNKLAFKFAKDHVGKSEEILFETRRKDGHIHGYTSNYLEVKTKLNLERNTLICKEISSLDNDGILVIK